MSDTLLSPAPSEEQREALLSLLAPFTDDRVGKLPRVTCADCSDRRKRCEEHKKAFCQTCKAMVSTKHIHIDYVGHADVTERLLRTDPFWSWEPFALDEDGLPKLDVDDLGHPVGLWIRLTVLGVTRPGYGSCPSNQSDAVKVLIGDALRNAAQRFGVAIAQWQKGDRDNPAAENPVADAGQRAMPAKQRAVDAAVVVDTDWVEVFEKNLATADADTAPGFRQDVIDAMRGGRINSDTANRLLAAVKARIDEIHSVTATGLPANKDGSVSRSKLTNEELAANGLMTKDEVKAHNKLARDTVANPKKADRLATTPADDPWAAGSKPADEVDGWPPVAKPGSGGAS